MDVGIEVHPCDFNFFRNSNFQDEFDPIRTFSSDHEVFTPF